MIFSLFRAEIDQKYEQETKIMMQWQSVFEVHQELKSLHSKQSYK